MAANVVLRASGLAGIVPPTETLRHRVIGHRILYVYKHRVSHKLTKCQTGSSISKNGKGVLYAERFMLPTNPLGSIKSRPNRT
jgi:hypothetical protein